MVKIYKKRALILRTSVFGDHSIPTPFRVMDPFDGLSPLYERADPSFWDDCSLVDTLEEIPHADSHSFGPPIFEYQPEESRGEEMEADLLAFLTTDLPQMPTEILEAPPEELPLATIKCIQRTRRNQFDEGKSCISFFQNRIGKSRLFVVHANEPSIRLEVSVEFAHTPVGEQDNSDFFLSFSFFRGKNAVQKNRLCTTLSVYNSQEFYLYPKAGPSKREHCLRIVLSTSTGHQAGFVSPPFTVAGHKFESTKKAKEFYDTQEPSMLVWNDRTSNTLCITNSSNPDTA